MLFPVSNTFYQSRYLSVKPSCVAFANADEQN